MALQGQFQIDAGLLIGSEEVSADQNKNYIRPSERLLSLCRCLSGFARLYYVETIIENMDNVTATQDGQLCDHSLREWAISRSICQEDCWTMEIASLCAEVIDPYRGLPSLGPKFHPIDAAGQLSRSRMPQLIKRRRPFRGLSTIRDEGDKFPLTGPGGSWDLLCCVWLVFYCIASCFFVREQQCRRYGTFLPGAFRE